MNIFELAIVVSAVDKATGTLRAVQGSLKGAAAAGEAMKEWGKQATVSGALMSDAGNKIVGALTSVLGPASEVEDALAKVATVTTGFVAGQKGGLEVVSKAAREWSTVHRDTSSQYLEAVYKMESANLSEKQAIAGTEAALRVATATFGNGGEAAALLATIYNNLGNKSADVTGEMNRLGDVITKTQQVFQIADLGVLTEGLKYATPVAKQFGMSIESVSAVIGTLNSAGINGGEAGTSFAATMRQMSAASKTLGFEIVRTASGGTDFAGTLRVLEQRFGTLDKMAPDVRDKLAQAFGDEGFRGLSLMLGKSQQLTASIDQLKTATGAAAAAQKIIESTGTAGWQILQNNINATKALLGDQLEPILKDIGPHVKSALDAFRGFAEAHPGLTKAAMAAGLLAGAFLVIGGGLLTVVGGFVMFAGYALALPATLTALGVAFGGASAGAWAFAAALLANPITWIVLAIAAAAFLIYKYWDPIKAFFVGLWGHIASVFSGIHPVDWVSGAFASLMHWLGSFSLVQAGMNILGTLTAGIKAAAMAPVDAVRGVVGKIRNLLPFSPAKDGPLRDLHRVRLIETIAEAVRPAPLVSAMHGAVSAAMIAIPLAVAATPALAPMPEPGLFASRGGATVPGDGVMHVQITIQGNADASTVDQLERWVRGNGRAIRAAVDRDRARESRTELG